MKVAVTGSRNWSDLETVRLALRGLPEGITILHGACRGLDAMVASQAACGNPKRATVIPFPADWDAHGKAAGPIRNRKMLDERPDLVLAFHDFWPQSGGTADMIEEAISRGIPVVFIQSQPSE